LRRYLTKRKSRVLFVLVFAMRRAFLYVIKTSFNY
jgi:hypothetical protein